MAPVLQLLQSRPLGKHGSDLCTWYRQRTVDNERLEVPEVGPLAIDAQSVPPICKGDLVRSVLRERRIAAQGPHIGIPASSSTAANLKVPSLVSCDAIPEPQTEEKRPTKRLSLPARLLGIVSNSRNGGIKASAMSTESPPTSHLWQRRRSQPIASLDVIHKQKQQDMAQEQALLQQL